MTPEAVGNRSSQIDELVLDHLQRRLCGEHVTDAGLITQHPELMPELADRLAELAELSPRQVEAGVATGQDSSLSPKTLQIRCPHCSQRVEVLADFNFEDITCSSCGSQFSLAGETVHTREAPAYKYIAQFELVERLGLGSFGTVWKARDTELDRTVAVKIPRRGQLDPGQIEKFLREARAAAQLNHKNIVRVYEVGRDGDNVYIVSELIRGVSLADWLTGKQPTFRESAILCSKIADALHHAHESGVIHRDLKPHNIMLDSEDEPHIMDFGLAKREAGEITMTVDGHVLGTPAYMSPEQARGEAHQADRRTDVYSLGVILFELLTGELPFRGNARMLIHQVLNDEAPSPRRLHGNVPRDLETICLKCLEKDAAKRYEGAGTVSAELRRVTKTEPILARPITQLERGWRWCRRNQMVSMLALAVVLTLTLGTLVASWQAVTATRQRHIAEGNHYQALMNLIRLDWEQNDIGRVRASLRDATAYSDRGFEYYIWRRRLHRSRMTLGGHLDRVADIAVSPDGHLIATASNDGTVKVWDANSGHMLMKLIGHTSWVRSVAFFPDGKRLLSSSDDLTTRVWDIETQRERLILRGHTGCRLFSALSGDGRRIVTTSYDGVINIWDSSSGINLQSINVGHQIWGVAFSEDGKRVVIGEEAHSENRGTARLWDLGEKRVLFELAHEGKVWSIEFSPNGKWLVTASGDGAARIWDAESGAEMATLLGHKGAVTSASFSPDSDRVATGGWAGAAKVWRWNGTTAKEEVHFRGHEHFVWATVFSPDNQTLVTGSSDGKTMFWDIAESEPRVLQHPPGVSVRSVAFVPSGDRVVSGSDDGMIRLWNVTTDICEMDFPGDDGHPVTSVSVAPSGAWIVVGSERGMARVWDLATGRPRFESPLVHDGAVTSVCVSSDGRWIATGSQDRTVKLWNAATGTLERVLDEYSSGIKSIVFSSDNRQIVANGDATAFWNVATGRMVHELDWTGNYYAGECLAISKELLVIGGSDEWQRPKADVWDRDGKRLQFTLRGHKRSFLSGSFSPDNRRIVTASGDRTVKIWDASTGRELLTLTGHTNEVRSAVFSADGLRIASGSLDGTVRVWKAASPAEVVDWNKEDEEAARYLVDLKRRQRDAGQRQVAQLRHDDGPIRQWLMLGPIKLTASDTKTALDDRPFGEMPILPSPHQPVTIGNRTMNWRAEQLEDYRFDFSSVFGPGVGRVLAYAVCYVYSDRDRQGVRIVTDNRGLGKIYLNGSEIYKRTVYAAHPFGRDTIPNLQLEAGRNVLVCKYVHLGGAWPGALRLTDGQGNSLSGIRVSVERNAARQVGEAASAR